MTGHAIPAAAIDAAADALVASRLGDHRGIHGEEFVEAARAALEAAAPHLHSRAVAYLDEAVRRITFDPDVKDYERGFDDATRGMAAKVKRLLNGEEQ